jgi:hypothetical protein
MRVRYIGPDIGVDGLVDGHIYDVVCVDPLTGYLSVIDESGEDYLYHPQKPQAIAGNYKGGKFEIVEDDADQTLNGIINT